MKKTKLLITSAIYAAILFMLQASYGMEKDMERQVDLRDATVLMPLLEKPEHLDAASTIVERVYEANLRYVGQTKKYGFAFPMHPEILAYLMNTSKGKVVLEIGGASGENAILLAFAGASNVYLNDIDGDEINKFETTKKDLPQEVNDRLFSIEGSIFDIVDTENFGANLQNKVDIILCRNVLHFFKDNYLPKFFNILDMILKPGGQAIFTVNSSYQFKEFEPIIKKNPDSKSFQLVQCRLTQYHLSNMPCHDIISIPSLCDGNLDPLSPTDQTVVFDITLGEVKPNLGELAKLQSILGPNFDAVICKIVGFLEEMGGRDWLGNVSLFKYIAHVYTQENFSELFSLNGFQVENSFCILGNGHILPHTEDPWLAENPKDRAQQVGVIARKKCI